MTDEQMRELVAKITQATANIDVVAPYSVATTMIIMALLRDLKQRDPELLQRVARNVLPDLEKQSLEVVDAVSTIFMGVDIYAPAPEGTPKH